MSYWMRKSPMELQDAVADDSRSVLDIIVIQALLRDMRYGSLKNTNILMDRIVGTPVNQMHVQSTVKSEAPVRIELFGVEAGHENTLQALKDLKDKEEDGE